jgi:hypothetical protein
VAIRVQIEIEITSVCLGADCFAFGELLDKAPSNQGLVLLVRPLVPRGPLTPVSLRGPAAIRHPWRGAALAASLPLGPLHKTCVQPAPKSRLAVFGLFAYEDQEQKQIKSKSRSRAFGLKPVPRSRAALPLIMPTRCVGMRLWTSASLGGWRRLCWMRRGLWDWL